MDRLTGEYPAGRTVHPDVPAGGLLLLVALAYGLTSLTIPPADGEPGPGFLPLILALCLGASAAAILVRGLRTGPGSRPGGTRETPATPETPEPAQTTEAVQAPEAAIASPRRPWAAAGMTLLYALLLEPLGFAPSTLAYVSGVTFLFGKRGWALAVVPVLVTLALYLFFRVGLGVRLPGGPLG